MSQVILLADDSVTIQKVIELTFMDGDYEVVAVSDGSEALARLDEVSADFVIADVHMPGASGYEVARKSKQLRPEVPVLLLVGTFEPFDRADADACGADDVLKKPFDSQELLRLVEELQRSSGEASEDAEPVAVAQEPDAGEETAPEAMAALDAEGTGEGAEGEAPDEGEILVIDELEELDSPELEAAGADEEDGEPFAIVDAEEEPAGGQRPGGDEPFGAAPAVDLAAATPVGEQIFELGDLDEADEAGEEEQVVAEAAEELERDETQDLSPAPERELDEPAVEGPAAQQGPAAGAGFGGGEEAEAPEAVEPPGATEALQASAGAPVVDLISEEEDEGEAAPEPSAEPEPAPGAAVTAGAAAGTPSGEAAATAGGLSDDDVDRIARRVAELIGDRVVREVTWEILPDLAEVVIKERLRELESQLDG